MCIYMPYIIYMPSAVLYMYKYVYTCTFPRDYTMQVNSYEGGSVLQHSPCYLFAWRDSYTLLCVCVCVYSRLVHWYYCWISRQISWRTLKLMKLLFTYPLLELYGEEITHTHVHVRISAVVVLFSSPSIIMRLLYTLCIFIHVETVAVGCHLLHYAYIVCWCGMRTLLAAYVHTHTCSQVHINIVYM